MISMLAPHRLGSARLGLARSTRIGSPVRLQRLTMGRLHSFCQGPLSIVEASHPGVSLGSLPQERALFTALSAIAAAPMLSPMLLLSGHQASCFSPSYRQANSTPPVVSTDAELQEAVAPKDADDGADAADAADTTTPEAVPELTPEPTADPAPPLLHQPSALQFVWQFVDGALLLVGSLLTLASVVVGVMVPMKSGALLKAATRGALSRGAVLTVLALVNAQAVLKVLGSYCLVLAGQKLKRRLRQLLFSSVLAQDLGWVASSRPAALVAQLTTDTDEVSRSVSASIGMAITSTATVLGTLVQLALISPHLTALVLAIAPPAAALAAIASRHDRALRKQATAASTASSVGAGDAFTKLPTIQAYAQEEREAARYGAMLERESCLQRNHLIFHKAWTSGLQLITNASTAAGLAFAGTLAARGLVDPSMILSFSQLSMSLSSGVGQILFLVGDVAKISDAADRLSALHERSSAIPPGGATLDKDSLFLRGEVRPHTARVLFASECH